MANATLIVIGAAVVTALVATVVQEQSLETHNAAAAANYTPAVTASPKPTRASIPPSASMKDAIAALKDDSKPFVMTIVGDSTGNDPKEWVGLVTERLAGRTGRPAVIHTWSPETESYDEDVRHFPGSGEPIVVWNGSASGKSGSYSRDHIETMAAEESDLFIVSHGHNHMDAIEAANTLSALSDWPARTWETAPTVAVVLQNPNTGDRAPRQASVVSALRSHWEDDENVVLIDVYSAFNDAEDTDTLLHADKLHPNEAGSQVWADAAWEDLSFNSL